MELSPLRLCPSGFPRPTMDRFLDTEVLVKKNRYPGIARRMEFSGQVTFSLCNQKGRGSPSEEVP